MSLFNLFADIVTAPIEVAKDVVTVGGLVTKQDESYTRKQLEKIVEDLEDLLD